MMGLERTYPRFVTRVRSSLVVCCFLLGLLVLTGPLQTVSLRPPAVQAQAGCLPSGITNDPTHIVQDCDLRGDGFADLEAHAVEDILALSQLPASDAARVRAWERDMVRAKVFDQLIAIIRKDPNDRTQLEQSIVDAIAAVVRQRRIDAAQYSLDQYDIWAAGPCTYQAPHGYTYEPDDAWCNLPLVQLFDHPDAPTVEDFLTYGYAEIYQEFQDGGAAELISGETARLLGVIAGFVAVGIAALVGANIGAAVGVTTGIMAAIHPYMALTVAKFSPALADAVAGAAGAASIGAIVTIVVLAIVIIIIQAISVAELTELPNQLQEALNQAQGGVDLRALEQSDEGKTEIYAAFILATLPDFPNAGSVPAAQAADRTFIITDSQGDRVHSHTINYQCWNPRSCQGEDVEHTARVHEGWFVDESDATGAERMTLEIDYIDWNGKAWTATRTGPQVFLHTRTGDDSGEFTSEEIKYLNPNGDQLTAVLNHPPTAPATPVPSETVTNGTFQLDWSPGSTDADDEAVSYTLSRCVWNTIFTDIEGKVKCTESVVASGLTSPSFEFTEGVPEISGGFLYRVRASDGHFQTDPSPLSAFVLIDKQAPAITLLGSTTPPNAFGWNNTDVTVEWSCTDPSTEPNVEPAGVVSEIVSTTVTTEGVGQSVTGICEDHAGNTSSHTIANFVSIDKTAPVPLFDGPYVVDEGSSIQLSSVSTDGLSGIASEAIALDGDDQFDDGEPATFNAVDGPSVHPVKLRVEDRAGNVAIAETTVTVLNVAPTIDEILTNGPIAQGQPAQLTVNASDLGVNDVLSYRFDCAGDGGYELGPQASNQAQCALDPSAAQTTIAVEVNDGDGGMTTGSVVVDQTLALCGSYATGAITTPGASGVCPAGTLKLVVPAVNPTTFCISAYTGALLWSPGGSCAAGYWPRVVPDDGPLSYCQHTWTGKLRYSWNGQCGAYETAGVIPG